MKTVSNYQKFSEQYRLNENVIKKSWGAVVNFFRKKFGESSWLYYALFLKKIGKLPSKKVEIIVPPNYEVDMENLPKESEVGLKTESLKNEQFGCETFNKLFTLNEETISLTHTDPGMRNVDLAGLVEKISRVYKMNEDRVKRGQPRKKNHALYIWGAPGIGKTEVLNSVAKELGIIVQEWHLSQIEPTDFRGVPKVENVLGSNDPNDERTVSKLPAIFPTDNGKNGRGGIMFFDEINRAPKMVLSAALSLCLGGKVGLYELPSMWIVVAAGNRPEDLGGAVATTIEPALANRFAHINYAPTFASWSNWALKQEHMNPDIIAFLTWNKSYFHKLDPEAEKMNWPSPRTWEMASEEEYAVRGRDWKNKIPLSEIQDIYTDLIGGEAAIAFKEYLQLKEHYNEKDVEDVYKKGKGAKKPPTRLDQARAAAASIAFFKKGEELTVTELTNVLEFGVNLASKEAQTTLLSFMKMAHPEIREKEPWKKIYWEYVKRWHVEEDETGMTIKK
jgi:hypothetical protein